jgi:multicomponent Na+:H+ antiporter subunit E
VSGAIEADRNDPTGSLARMAAFLGFWLVLSGFSPVGFLIGILAAATAARMSVRLLPPGPWRVRPIVVSRLLLRFLRQSIVAGVDVAWRALDPRLPLRTGFVVYRTHLAPGALCEAFCVMTSLLPGSLPCGRDGAGNLVIHCLDVTQPVAEQLAAEEALLVRALGDVRRDG